MGRPRMTPEKRAEKIDESTRVKLLVTAERLRATRAEEAKLDAELRKLVKKAVKDGASFRDLAATLKIPHQTLHDYVHQRAA